MTTIIFGILEEGLVYAIMALGVYITYKILDFPDLSVDGTFPLGAAVTAAGIANGLPFIGTISPVAALFISFAVGALAGCITGLIHVKLKVRDLLSGIIVMTALYSINLRITGKANLPIFSKETIFSNSFLSAHVPEAASPFIVTIILFVIVLVCKVLLDAYLQTRSGYLLRAVGDVKITIWMGISEVITRIGFAFLFSYLWGYHGLWWVSPLTWWCAAGVGGLRYLSGVWK